MFPIFTALAESPYDQFSYANADWSKLPILAFVIICVILLLTLNQNMKQRKPYAPRAEAKINDRTAEYTGDAQALIARTEKFFTEMQTAWSNGSLESLRSDFTPELFSEFEKQLAAGSRSRKKVTMQVEEITKTVIEDFDDTTVKLALKAKLSFTIGKSEPKTRTMLCRFTVDTAKDCIVTAYSGKSL